jgi:hypothetical protein
MVLFEKRKDGGPNSPVDAYFLIESKRFFSIALLKFNKGGREAFHTHAFNALTWFIKGDILEKDVKGCEYQYTRSFIPKLTRRSMNHRVKAVEDSWCLTVRGPWKDIWSEYLEEGKV